MLQLRIDNMVEDFMYEPITDIRKDAILINNGILKGLQRSIWGGGGLRGPRRGWINCWCLYNLI